MQLIWAAVTGMVVYLNTTAIAQMLICQPIIACPIWGLIVGQPDTGLIVGAVFQLIYLGNLQIGAARFAEGNIGAFIATVLATQFSEVNGGAHFSLTLLFVTIIGLIAAQMGSYLAPTVRRIVGRIVPQYVLAAEQGKTGKVRSWFVLAVGVHMLAGYLYSFVWLMIGTVILKFVSTSYAIERIAELASDESLTSDFSSILIGALLGVGSAVAGSVLVRKKTIPLFLIVVIIGAISHIWYFSCLVDLTYSLETGGLP